MQTLASSYLEDLAAFLQDHKPSLLVAGQAAVEEAEEVAECQE